MRKHINVVAAIIEHEGKIFVARRAYGNRETINTYEFPGGKIEPDETPQAALKREIQEEFATIIKPGRQLITIEYAYDDFDMTLMAFLAKLVGPMPQNLEHADIRWLTPNELDQVNFGPADRQVAMALKKEFKK